MNDAPTMTDAPPLDGKAIAELAEQLNQLLRLRTFPIGMKLFEDLDAMANVPGLRRPPKGKTFSTCQLVTQARMAGFTLGITTENIPRSPSCSSVIGLDAPGEIYTSGRKMEGVWFENREAAAAHQARHAARAAGPLSRHGGVAAAHGAARSAGHLPVLRQPGADDPVHQRPAVAQLPTLRLLHHRRERLRRQLGPCAEDAQVSLSIPCYAERRYGGVADDEMLMACPPADLQRAVTGLQGLSKAGLRYPIMPFGPQAEPGEGMAKSYAGKS